MSTPIKRLEIIKNAIELEDDDIIRSQLKRLKRKPLTMNSCPSSRRLSRKTIPQPFALSPRLQSQRAVTPWRDPQLAASKLELKARKSVCAI